MITTVTTVALGCLVAGEACAERTTVETQQSPKNITLAEQPGHSKGRKAEPAPEFSGRGDLGSRIEEAESRMVRLKPMFASRGTAATFLTLNGKDSTNSAGARLQDEDFKVFVSDPNNGISGVKCIEDSKFQVTGTGAGRGEDAMGWKDAYGNSILPLMIQALHGKDSGRVKFKRAVESPMGGDPIIADVTAVVVSSKYLLGKKNTGKPFLCYIEIEH